MAVVEVVEPGPCRAHLSLLAKGGEDGRGVRGVLGAEIAGGAAVGARGWCLVFVGGPRSGQEGCVGFV